MHKVSKVSGIMPTLFDFNLISEVCYAIMCLASTELSVNQRKEFVSCIGSESGKDDMNLPSIVYLYTQQTIKEYYYLDI